MNKSQSSVEFMIVVAAGFFILVVFLIVLQSNILDKTKEKINLEMNQVAITVQNEINLATSASNGYKRTFILPSVVGGMNYTLNISGNILQISTTNGNFALGVSVLPVQGNIKKDSNIIRNQNGTVFLNE
ncbi:MAG: hypothetical protein AABX48_01770 [Nanoarchaeota archaeon]